MTYLKGTTKAQTIFLRHFRANPNGPPADQWPSPVILRRMDRGIPDQGKSLWQRAGHDVSGPPWVPEPPFDPRECGEPDNEDDRERWLQKIADYDEQMRKADQSKSPPAGQARAEAR